MFSPSPGNSNPSNLIPSLSIYTRHKKMKGLRDRKVGWMTETRVRAFWSVCVVSPISILLLYAHPICGCFELTRERKRGNERENQLTLASRERRKDDFQPSSKDRFRLFLVAIKLMLIVTMIQPRNLKNAVREYSLSSKGDRKDANYRSETSYLLVTGGLIGEYRAHNVS